MWLRCASLRTVLLAPLLAMVACGGGAQSATANHPAPSVSSAAAADAEGAACAESVTTLLQRLREPVRVTLYASRDLPGVAAAAGHIEAILRRWQLRAGPKLEVRVDNLATERAVAEAKEAGLRVIQSGKYSMLLGVAVAYRAEKDAIPIVTPAAIGGMERWMAWKVAEVHARADGVKLHIGAVTGKDELRLDEPALLEKPEGKRGPSVRGILAEALPYYDIAPVALDSSAGEIPEHLRAVIVTQPGKDYTEDELRRLDHFLMRGNRTLIVFASAVNMAPGDAHMAADLTTHGLDRLLAGYGVEMASDVIVDWGSPAMLTFQQKDGRKVGFGNPAMILAHAPDGPAGAHDVARLDPSFPAFFHLEELDFPFATTLTLHPDRQPQATVRAVARSSAKATPEHGSQSLHPDRTWKPSRDFAARPIAAAVEGRIRSAFAPGETSRSDSRVLVISSAQFLVNPYARAINSPDGLSAAKGDDTLKVLARLYSQQYLTEMILVFKNTLDWAVTPEFGLRACDPPVSPR